MLPLDIVETWSELVCLWTLGYRSSDHVHFGGSSLLPSFERSGVESVLPLSSLLGTFDGASDVRAARNPCAPHSPCFPQHGLTN